MGGLDSLQRGEPVEFKLTDVVPGWTEGIAMMQVGGKAKHPTLGHVTILVLGPLGAKIEFFSNAPGETRKWKEAI